MRDNSSKFRTFSRRALIIGGLKLAFFAMVGARYYYLQVNKSDKYSTMSDKNRFKMMVLSPQRGVIYDKNKQVIASSTQHFKLGIDSMAIKNVSGVLADIERVLGRKFEIPEDELKRKINKRQINDYLFVKENLSWSEVAKLTEGSHLMDGADVVEASHREYMYKDAFSHITGYVSAPNKQEIEDLVIPISSQMKIGKSGIEKYFDETLRGSPGLKKTEVDVRGRYVRTIATEKPISGTDLHLTIDVRIQEYLHSLLTGKGLTASAVVLNAKTGEVLGLHSTPSFDPNLFVDGISQDDWKRLNSTKDNPLINHAVSSPYPPGSTFKPITILAALMAGFDPKTTFHCSGHFTLGQHTFKCWNLSGHGTIDMRAAISKSCNPYMYNIALKMGVEKLSKAAKLLGMGQRTGIELMGESSGILIGNEWKKRRFNQPWFPGDTVNCSIGQGYALMTPLQIATSTLRIASGKNLSPRLTPINLDDIEELGVDDKLLQVVRDGMYQCVNEPGGVLYNRHLSIGDMTICGKTGTAQVVSLKYKNAKREFHHHGLFTSFAPFNDPRYVVTVVVEHGDAGARVAPLARDIYEFMLSIGYA